MGIIHHKVDAHKDGKCCPIDVSGRVSVWLLFCFWALAYSARILRRQDVGVSMSDNCLGDSLEETNFGSMS